MRYLAASLLLALLLGATVLPGDALRTRRETGEPLQFRPILNSDVAWTVGYGADDTATAGATIGHALYSEALSGGQRSVWGLYSEVRQTHDGGGAVPVYARLRNDGAGWGAAVHAEPIATGTGTTVGVNVEPSPMVAAGRVIGVNVQAQNGYGHDGAGPGVPVAQGINLQTAPDGGSFSDGIRFDGAVCDAGLHFDTRSQSTRAIWIQGTHGTGIESNAPIRVSSGVPVELSTNGAVEIVFANGRVEFRNGARVLAYIAIDGTATGARLN